MSKDRQRAKQRQAQRRRQRWQEEGTRAPGAPRPEGGDGATAAPDPGRVAVDGFEAEQGGTVPAEVGIEEGADLAASAPPEALGRSDTVVETAPPPRAADPDLAPEAAASQGEAGAPDEGEDAHAHERGKLVAFLVAVWAELKRVQWPTREQITTLTGVVLAFVIIMGAYLGALDAIFSRLMRVIL